MNEKERGIVDEAYRRMELWEQGCREIHERAREARRILLLQDPQQKKNVLQMETLKSTFTNCVADQMDNLPEAVMVPETAGFAEVAQDLTDVVRFILDRNGYETLHRLRTEDCFCTGTAVTQVYWDGDMDGGRGNVALLRWPIEGFLWDPCAEKLQEGRAVFKRSLHPMSWFWEHYPDKAAEIVPDGYAYGEGEILPGDEDTALLVEYWTRHYDAELRRYRVDAAILAGHCLLWSGEDVYRHGLYPFVLDVYTRLEGLPVGDGMVQELAPMMRAINRYQSYIDTNLRMSSKGRLLVDRGAGIDKAALCDWEKDVIEGDRIDPGALQWLQTQPFGGMAAQQVLQLQTDLKQDSGQNQFTRGETVGGVTAASAISALQEAGGKITRLRTATLNQGFKGIVEQVLWLVSQFYDEGRVVCITGEQGVREIPAGAKRLFGAVPPPPYSVQVQVQRRNPLRVQAQNELYLEAYRMSAQAGQPIPLSALFELLQVDGKERVLPMLRAAEGLPERMQELEEMCRNAARLMEGERQSRGELTQMLEGRASEADAGLLS